MHYSVFPGYTEFLKLEPHRGCSTYVMAALINFFGPDVVLIRGRRFTEGSTYSSKYSIFIKREKWISLATFPWFIFSSFSQKLNQRKCIETCSHFFSHSGFAVHGICRHTGFSSIWSKFGLLAATVKKNSRHKSWPYKEIGGSLHLTYNNKEIFEQQYYW